MVRRPHPRQAGQVPVLRRQLSIRPQTRWLSSSPRLGKAKLGGTVVVVVVVAAAALAVVAMAAVAVVMTERQADEPTRVLRGVERGAAGHRVRTLPWYRSSFNLWPGTPQWSSMSSPPPRTVSCAAHAPFLHIVFDVESVSVYALGLQGAETSAAHPPSSSRDSEKLRRRLGSEGPGTRGWSGMRGWKGFTKRSSSTACASCGRYCSSLCSSCRHSRNTSPAHPGKQPAAPFSRGEV